VLLIVGNTRQRIECEVAQAIKRRVIVVLLHDLDNWFDSFFGMSRGERGTNAERQRVFIHIWNSVQVRKRTEQRLNRPFAGASV
jgi:hypothetical protein